jgi:hypothetical protein
MAPDLPAGSRIRRNETVSTIKNFLSPSGIRGKAPVPCGRFIISDYRFSGVKGGFRRAGTGPGITEQNRMYLMKRRMVIAITLCLLVLAIVGTCAAAAQQKLPPPYRVVQYNVTYHNEAVGRMSINTNDWMYILNAHGLEPGGEYFFSCRGRFPYLANGTANGDGDLHMKGVWDPHEVNVADPYSTLAFILSDRPLLGGERYTYIDAEYCNPMWLYTKLWGRLYYWLYNEKAGIADQQVTIWLYEDKTGGYTKYFGTATTDSNGEFLLTKSFAAPKYQPLVRFDGNDDWRHTSNTAEYLPVCPIT